MRPTTDKPKTQTEKVRRLEKFWKIVMISLVVFGQIFFVVGLATLFGGTGFFIGGLVVLTVDILITGLIWFVLQDELNH